MKSLKSWPNKVFCQNDTPDTSEASLNTSGEVINTSDTDGIGEPILSFIETFRNNPERFTRVNGSLYHGELIDTSTDTGFELRIHPLHRIELSSWKCGPPSQSQKVTCFSQKNLNICSIHWCIQWWLSITRLLNVKIESLQLDRKDYNENN